MANELFILLIAYLVLFIINLIPLYYYGNRELLSLSINNDSAKYISYLIFAFVLEAIFIYFGVYLENEKIHYDEDTEIIIIALLNSIVFAPIAEEIFFRSHLFHIIKRMGLLNYFPLFWASLVSLVWTSFHYESSFYFFVHTFIIGILLFKLRMSSGSISYCILMHSLCNVIGIAALLARDL